MASAHAPGFIITSGGTGMGASVPVYILDSDGEPVWWATAPANCSRAKMSWDGKEMWMQELNVDNAGGEVRKIAMDGTGAMNNIAGLNTSHHDFTVLPDGGIATMLWNTSGMDVPGLACCGFVRMARRYCGVTRWPTCDRGIEYFAEGHRNLPSTKLWGRLDSGAIGRNSCVWIDATPGSA